MDCPHGNNIPEACNICISAADEAEIDRLRGLLKDARDGLAGQPELDTDAIIRGIDAELLGEDS